MNRIASRLAPLFPFLFFLGVSWRRWTNPIIDAGRELDLPRRLLAGEMLYRDVHYLYPPLSPYINALLYHLFGPKLEVLNAAGICASLVVMALCYAIARRILNPFDAALATASVVLLCIFKPGGNLISPYAFAALLGMIFALACLLLILRYGEDHHRLDLIGAGIFIGLAAITKQEFAFAAALVAIASLLHDRGRPARVPDVVSRLSLIAGPALLISVITYGYFLWRVGWHVLVDDCHLLFTHLPPSIIFYNAHRTGLDEPIASVAQLLSSLALMIVATGTIGMVSALLRRSGDRERIRSFVVRTGLIVFTSLLAIELLKPLRKGGWDGSPFRALPIILLVIIVITWKKRTNLGSYALFCVSIFSIAILARVVLRVPSGGAYGAFFLPTSLLVTCYIFLEGIPEWIGRRFPDPVNAGYARTGGRVLLLVLLAATAIVFSSRYRRSYTTVVEAQHGRLITTAAVGEAMNEAIEFIEQNTKPEEAIAAFPEGSDLAFLTGRRVPTRFQIFLPGFLDSRAEKEEIGRMETAAVRYLFIVNRSTREFGANAFGKDYYPMLGRWIDDHFHVVKTCGPPAEGTPEIGNPTFFIQILEHN